jgi:peroxiredoxin
MAALGKGARAPAFTLTDIDGETRSFSELGAGDLLLLIFYHRACATCRLIAPLIGHMSRTLQSKHAKVWGISHDPEEESDAFALDHGFKMPVMIDEPPFAVSEAYGLTNVPTLFLIDGSRRIIKSCVGFSKSDFIEIAAALAQKSGIPAPDLFADYNNLPEFRPG